MIHKKTLLIAFLLSLFMLQQTQVSAKFSPNKEEASQVNSIQASELPTQLYITVAHLNETTNYPIYNENNEIEKCSYRGDPAYGCGETGYPYDLNPLWIDIESNYLLNVLPREMNVAENDPTVEALKAQAVAARSYAAYRIPTDNSVNFQIYIPNSYELYDPSSSGLVYDAVTSTQGRYLSQGGSVIDGQFASDSIDRTATCINADGTQCHPYLIRVEDPISVQGLSNSACDAINNGNASVDDPATAWNDIGKVWGMSQKGAIRWSLGNHCTTNGGNQPWPVTWNDYRQILVHYYTGIDILNSNGTLVAPNDRWNLLWHSVPASATVNPNTPINFDVRIQNTSIFNWAANEIKVWYKWDNRSWIDTGINVPATQKGQDQQFNVSNITSPSDGGETLHLDLRRQNESLFSEQSPTWPDATINIHVNGPEATSTATTSSRGFYPNGIHVKYYNDVAPAQIYLDQPINWNTFTTLVAESDVQMINFNWGTTSPAPGVNATFWSARYEGQLLVPQSGTYTFYLDSLDDGGRLFIDGNAIIDKWLVQGPHFYSASIPLTAGTHAIKIEYAQGPGAEGSISVAWELPSGFAKELIGSAAGGPTTPGPTPTPIGGTPVTPQTTPFITVTPIPPTPIPTTPAPCNCIIEWFCPQPSAQSVQLQSVSLLNSTGTPMPANTELLADASTTTVDPVARASLIYRVRDELMNNSTEGQRLTNLYYDHSLEIATLMLADSNLYDQGFAALDAFLPSLQALLDGNGTSVTVTAEQVAAAQAFLDALSSAASPELQQAIQQERANNPLESMVGLTMSQAWSYVSGTFPTTGILDNFNRANGSIGSNWSGNTAGYSISSNKLLVKARNSNLDIYWKNTSFGPNQEAYFTFSSVNNTAIDQDLILKGQSMSGWGDGMIVIQYDASTHNVIVWTYDHMQSWVEYAPIPVTFVNGDQFGARALSNGMVEIYRNGTLLATRNISAWPHNAKGGYLGLWFGNAKDALIDDFGGGTIP